MKTENLSIGLRVLYHAIEWLTVFLILLIFAVQIITPLYAVRVGRADSFLQQLQWLPYRPGVLALGVMLAAVGTILSKCSHEVDSGFLSRSSWQLYLLEGRAVQCLGADLPAELRQNRSVCDRGYGGRPARSPAEALSERHDRGVPFLQHGRRHHAPSMP